MSARASLSELRLDEDGQDADGYETPKYGFRSLDKGKGRIWEKRAGDEDTRQDMMVDDEG